VIYKSKQEKEPSLLKGTKATRASEGSRNDAASSNRATTRPMKSLEISEIMEFRTVKKNAYDDVSFVRSINSYFLKLNTVLTL